MSDISLHITWLDLVLGAPVIGWPGLIVGGALGALAWRKRWYFGALLGALVGSVAWAMALVLL